MNHDRFFGLIGVEWHTTMYEDGSGCFPLCEGCWASMSPTERLPYYDALVSEWIFQSPGWIDEYLDKRDSIRHAVLAGL